PSDTLNDPNAKAVIIGYVTSARVGTNPPFIKTNSSRVHEGAWLASVDPVAARPRTAQACTA
ncbi:MAG: hypothetical protein ACSLFJ_10780, partial [Immundisolibacter sp.]|uniref:hypothetical protein n=1 Tax=Immundisolibacter sp. TaxID=1934948 RepID=UPI003EE3E5F4